MFPPIFCVPTSGDLVVVFSSIQVRPRVYTVAPYRILHGTAMEEAYAMDGRFGGHPSHISNDPLTLIAYHPEFGALTSESTWVHCGTTVFSMYCGTAIPMLEFIHRVSDETTATGFHEERGLPPDWFRLCNGENILPIVEGSRSDIRRWVGRWNPMSWFSESGAGEATASSDSVAGPNGPARGGSPIRIADTGAPAPAPPLPKYVADLLIRDAENRNATCPITMEPIQTTTATATPCFHVFNTTALSSWLSSGHSTCPECRSHISAAPS